MHKIKKILSSRFYIFICIILLGFLLFSIINDNYKNKSVEERFEQLQSEIEKLEADKQALLKDQDYIGTDVYFEREARSKLNLKKPGEEVWFVKSLENNEQSDISDINESANNTETAETQSGFDNFIKWFEYFVK